MSVEASTEGVVPRALVRDSHIRLTAADRPGIAQPVPERDIPSKPWGPIALVAVVLTLVMLAGWEYYWRAFGVTPGYRNSDGEWAQQRRRIDQGEGGKTVLLGASRVLFDLQLPIWEKVTGERPIQLALEGTSPLPMLEDLAADQNFTGRALVGIAPDVFFTGFQYRGNVLPYYRKQSPSQRSGNWLSMQLLEPYFAFYDPDYRLSTVYLRQDWAARRGKVQRTRVRKLSMSDSDRNTYLWDKLVTDAEYRELARRIWAQDFDEPLPDMETPEKFAKVVNEQIEKAATAVAKLRARGVPVVFVRMPSAGEYYAYEQKYLPRATTWELLLKRTGVPGIHFEDYPQLQNYYLPEWSHMSHAEGVRFTAELAPLVERELADAQQRELADAQQRELADAQQRELAATTPPQP